MAELHIISADRMPLNLDVVAAVAAVQVHLPEQERQASLSSMKSANRR